eukprot:5693500-Pyramimonas_sp.AAC.1
MEVTLLANAAKLELATRATTPAFSPEVGQREKAQDRRRHRIRPGVREERSIQGRDEGSPVGA